MNRSSRHIFHKEIARLIVKGLIGSLAKDGSYRSFFRSTSIKYIMLGVAGQGGARLASIVAAYSIVPLALGYLGPERYGLWMAVSSLVAMFAMFGDGGICNSLITATAVANQKGGPVGVRRVLASAAWAIIPLSVVLLVFSALLAWALPWGKVFNLQNSSLVRDAGWTVFIVSAAVIAGFSVNMVLKVRAGLQQLAAVSVWDALAALSAIPGLLLAIRAEASLPVVTAAVVGPPLLVKILGAFWFLYQNPAYMPKVSDISKETGIDLLRGGTVFLVMTLSQAVTMQAAQILIANQARIEDVATYSVLQRLFALPHILSSLLFNMQWPMFSAAAERGDFAWIRSMFRRALVTAVPVSLVLAAALIVFIRPILDLWVGPSIDAPGPLVIGMGALSVLLVLAGAFATLAISLDVRRPVTVISILTAVITPVLSYFCLRNYGVAGAVWGTVLAYLLCSVIPYSIVAMGELRRREGLQKLTTNES